MIIGDLLAKHQMTRYRLAKQAGTPHATLKVFVWRKDMIDFTSCRIVPGKAYNGANGSKIAVIYKVNLQTISDFIMQAEGISDLQKEFYITYINARYDLILRPSYKLLTPV